MDKYMVIGIVSHERISQIGIKKIRIDEMIIGSEMKRGV